MFLPQETGTFDNIEKEPLRVTPKMEEICTLYVYQEYLLCLQFKASGSFLQTYTNFVAQQLKFFSL